MIKLVFAVSVFISGLFVSVPAVEASPTQLRCDERFTITALAASGRSAGIRQVDYVMWRESRCRQVAFNPYDPMGGSYGLFQINAFWCKPNRYTKRGWLQEQGILENCEELFDPMVNAEAFMAIYDYSHKHNGNGWLPWGGKPQWNSKN
jgi:hypothetical protein